MNASSVRIVTATAASYSCIFATSSHLLWPTSDSRANLKAISSIHSLLSTVLGVRALLNIWPIEEDQPSSSGDVQTETYLDDSRNPLIAGKSTLGTAVTRFETGYLLYDNIALPLVTQSEIKRDCKSLLAATISHLLHNEPLLVIHHVGILSGLGTLQSYIRSGDERGIWIIVAMILMRASDPVLHCGGRGSRPARLMHVSTCCWPPCFQSAGLVL